MSASNLQDCGHYRDREGICRFQGCAKQLCTQCIAVCAVCGITLCPDHTEELNCAPDAAFCDPCRRAYLKQQLFMAGGSAVADRVFGRRNGGA